MTIMTTTTGASVRVDTVLDELDAELVGSLIRPDDVADDEARALWNGLIDRARGCIDAFPEASTGREYLNFPDLLEGGTASVRIAHGEENHRRLARLRRRLDPDNRFQLHQNVVPVEELDQS